MSGESQAYSRCPSHDDRSPSLSIAEGDVVPLVLECFAGCTFEDVLAHLLGVGKINPDPERAKRIRARLPLELVRTEPITGYAYDSYSLGVTLTKYRGQLVDRETGEVVKEKAFTWTNTIDGVERRGAGGHIPRLFEYRGIEWAQDHDLPIYLTEGEKDQLGVVQATQGPAVSVAHGAGTWLPEWTKEFAGVTVPIIICADDDEPDPKTGKRAGIAHAQMVAAELVGLDVSIRLPATGNDVSDHLAAGHTMAELVLFEAVAESAVQPELAVLEAPELLSGLETIEAVRSWLARFICPMSGRDLDLLAAFVLHTHLCVESYSTPRIVLDSPIPGSGKTTVLEHLYRLCLHPVQTATLSSPAMLTRMLDAGLRTILIDEADRSLDPKRPDVGDLLAVLNSGYTVGATRPVLAPSKAGGWEVAEMPTFAPVVMAGNNPALPDDTRSRSIRIILMPDIEGLIEESDWEINEEPARKLGASVAAWADTVRADVRSTRPTMSAAVIGRVREKWGPLKRIADQAGGRWPAVIDALALLDVARIDAERDEGITQQKPAVVLLAHVREVWSPGDTFLATETIIDRLVDKHADVWGLLSPYGKRLTPQRMGRMLVTTYDIHAEKSSIGRGYALATFTAPFLRMGLTPPS